MPKLSKKAPHPGAEKMANRNVELRIAVIWKPTP